MAPGASRTRRRASHSLDAVVEAAVAILDESGEPALTFRALAARLGGGVGSIYWYVSNKEELLNLATDHVIADVLVETSSLDADADPLDNVRALHCRKNRQLGAMVGNALNPPGLFGNALRRPMTGGR